MKITLLALLLSALPAFAQDSPISMLTKHLTVSRDYTLAVAGQMPAESYTFKPNKDEMSFGEQMNHIANANAMFTGAISGAKGKSYKETGKASVIASLTDAFDSAIETISKLSGADLHKEIKGPDGASTVLDSILLMLDHTTHHRAQCIVYLRVKGIKPTDYRF